MHISMEPRNPEKYDYKCVKNETAKIFVAMELKVGKGLTQSQKKNHDGFETIREDSLYRKIGANEIETLTHDWLHARREGMNTKRISIRNL